ncbi:Fic family protein [Oceanicaulis sp. HTCC2633]|uniref:Fic family protein n=1 Tax=Oceanicaulis sp. HTCC2633 TaxID=314254 RepID=UPI0009FD91D2|nr:Fic family protein [Oceanicaulis sp. HTCC2633]
MMSESGFDRESYSKTDRVAPKTYILKGDEHHVRISALPDVSSPGLVERSLAVQSMLCESDLVWKNTEDVFGLELRLAYQLEHDIKSIRSKYFKIEGGGPSLRRFFLRPSTEAIVHAYRNAFTPGAGGVEAMEGLGSWLYGSERQFRTNRAQTSRGPGGYRVVYPKTSEIEDCLFIRENRQISDYHTPLLWAIRRFADFNTTHPFLDGTGRTARALFIIDLMNYDIIAKPSLPLGPMQYLFSGELLKSYLNLYIKNNWEYFAGTIMDIIVKYHNYLKYINQYDD